MDKQWHNIHDMLAHGDEVLGPVPEGCGSGWVQWKGTKVCVDLHCVCGHSGHQDAEFMYYIRCEECDRVYQVNPRIVLVPLDGALRAEALSTPAVMFPIDGIITWTEDGDA